MSWIVRLEVPAEQTELITSGLWDAGTDGVAELGGSDVVTLLAGFAERDAADSAAATFGGVVEPVLATDWAITEASTVEVGDVAFTVVAGTAFGHGGHPTTRLALDAISELANERDLGVVLDIGTGTGVLTIAAAALGATAGTGIDIDGDAVDIAKRNVDTNRELLGSATIKLLTGELATVVGEFDTVVANMLLADLRPLAPLIAERATGTLIVSGFLTDQASQVRQLFPSLTVVDHRHNSGWAMLRFDRDF